MLWCRALTDLLKVIQVEVEGLGSEPRQPQSRAGSPTLAFQCLTQTWDQILFLPLTLCIPRSAIDL